MIGDIVLGIVLWFVVSFCIKFVQNYSDIVEERSEEPTKTVFLQIDVEHFKGLWYGWYISDDQEAFVAQGATYEEAVLNCKTTLERKNPEFKIVFRFEKKQHEQPALQS
jgi:hypothetical protein